MICTPKPPACKRCVYFNKGTCKLFKYKFATAENNSIDFYVDAELVRQDISLCGPDGNYFKLKSK